MRFELATYLRQAGFVNRLKASQCPLGERQNNWLADFCEADPERLFGAAMVLPQDIDATVAEVRRSVRELGFKAIYIRPNPVRGRNWHDPIYDPLWACARSSRFWLAFTRERLARCPTRVIGSTVVTRICG